MTKTSLKALFLALAVAVAIPVSALAAGKSNGVFINVDKNKTIEGNYYVVANGIEVDGHITGDLFCAGDYLKITGTVDGDVICAAHTILIEGVVNGSVRSIATVMSVENKIGRNLMVAAGDLAVGPKGNIGMDAMFWAARVRHDGRINGSVFGRASRLFMTGAVGEDLRFVADDFYSDYRYRPLELQAKATIGGDLRYKANYDAYFRKRSSIGGRVIKEESNTAGILTESVMSFWIWTRIIAVFGAFILGALLLKFARKPVMEIIDGMLNKSFLATVGRGALVVALTPVFAILFALTIAGLPVSIILMSFWMGAVMIAKPIAAIMFGYVVIGRYYHKPNNKKARQLVDKINPYFVMMIGVAIVYAALAVPFFGSILAIFLNAWVIGSVWNYLKALKQLKA
jgi:cytoskeletal protein CcmA (bactofilin family)